MGGSQGGSLETIQTYTLPAKKSLNPNSFLKR